MAKKLDLEKATIPELEAHLDECRESEPKPYLKSVMAVRNQKIKQAELDHWCLTEEQYDVAIAKSEARAEVEREIEALDIAHAKADSADKSDLMNQKTALMKQLKEIPEISKHKCLQDAQRAAFKQVRDVQTAKAGSIGGKATVKGVK